MPTSFFILPVRRGAATGALLLFCGLLSACGQRGPLFLPNPPATAGSGKAPSAESNTRPQQLPARSDEGVKNPPAHDSKPATPTW